MRNACWCVVVVFGVASCLLLSAETLPRAVAQKQSGKPTVKASDSSATTARGRVRSGLQALYDFRGTSGPVVKDRSGAGAPVDLKIADPKAVRRTAGSLEVRGKTLIRSDKRVARIVNAVRRSGEITIEAWIRPAKIDQSGPARIVTLSKNASERNFTLGQDKDRFEVRFRTSKTSTNGTPALISARRGVVPKLTHVAYTRDRSGRTRMYVNGKPNAEGKVAGETTPWNGSYSLALANELDNSRPWLGTYHLVAIYNRDLSPREIEQNFKAGSRTPVLAQNAVAPGAKLFETQIAPLLAQKCLECHDASSKKGGLDLSRKRLALAGGESGKAIAPGKASASLLWESVEADEMPSERDPLSADEKTLLRKWIDGGAVWSLDVVDPAIYANEGRANKNWVRRLTVTEYIATVRSAVGVDIAKEAREILPADLRADGFSNTAYNLNVDLGHVNAYSRLAEIIVGRMDVMKFAAKFSKSRKLSTDDTMRQFVADMGRRLLRGPLDEREVTAFSGIATTVASAGGDFREAVGYLIEAMLQSPRFLYRIESQRGDGTAWPVGEHELASRLSYMLWGAPPDDELMRAADTGTLDRSGVESQVRRMLQDPRAIERSLQFAAQWLDLDRLGNLKPNAEKFPDWDARLAGDMRAETLAFFREVVWTQQRPLAELFNAQITYATPRLAKHYGLKSRGEGLVRYDVSSVRGRGGLLTQGAVLTVGGDEASMVSRGLFLLKDILRGVVDNPPPDLEVKPLPTKPGFSQRGIAEVRIANPACGACHVRFEPLAYGLEKFDGLGVYRDIDEHGNKLRDDGKILFPGQEKPVAFESSREMMDLLAGSERVSETMTWKVTQFALGRPLVAADARILKGIHTSAQKAGGTYAALMTAIVTSDLVLMTRTEEEP